MVTEYGMSANLGPVSYAGDGGDVFLGRDFATRKDYSEQKAREIDDEVAEILTTKYDEARQMLIDRRDLLDAVAEALLERETLEGPQLQMLLRGEPLPALGVDGDAESGTAKRPSRGERDEDVPEGGAGSKLPDPEPLPG
jgi:cell division protease FtsH